jgi:DNA replication protein DnaD
MSKVMFDYTKSILERVSFDPLLFCKELEKAVKTLLPFELEQLKKWLFEFIISKPELKQCMLIVETI